MTGESRKDGATGRAAKQAAALRYPAIILAAGISSRMGSPKPLLPFGNVSVIRRVADICAEAASVGEIIFVTNQHAAAIEKELAGTAVNLARNNTGGEMFTSIVVGIDAITRDTGAFFVLPGDLPLLAAATFDALANAMLEESLLCAHPVWQGRRGHPVHISSMLIPEIRALTAGETLKTVLARYPESSREIPVPDPGAVMDIDTQEEYDQALRLFANQGLSPNRTVV